MHVNIMRPCVGIHSPMELYDHQLAHRGIVDDNGRKLNYFTTRNTPKRANELLDGGSVYWIIKGAIVMRQTILDVETLLDDNGKKYCLITKDPEIILTTPKPQRAMQGWRYLEANQAPKDLYPLDPDAENEQDQLDEGMAKDLAELGLL